MTRSGNFRIQTGQNRPADIRDTDVVVVIDNLRASSTIVTALHLGVKLILPVLEGSRMATLKKQGFVLAGESGCIKIDGYDIGNSPVELTAFYEKSPFARLALKTSNLIPLLCSLPRAVICSTLNLDAVASHVQGKDVVCIAVGGERGSVEDLGVAFALSACLVGVDYSRELARVFTLESPAAQNLRALGFADDVDFISRGSTVNVLPYYDGETIKNYDYSDNSGMFNHI